MERTTDRRLVSLAALGVRHVPVVATRNEDVTRQRVER
jgi:hypothetical protein